MSRSDPKPFTPESIRLARAQMSSALADSLIADLARVAATCDQLAGIYHFDPARRMLVEGYASNARGLAAAAEQFRCDRRTPFPSRAVASTRTLFDEPAADPEPQPAREAEPERPTPRRPKIAGSRTRSFVTINRRTRQLYFSKHARRELGLVGRLAMISRGATGVAFVIDDEPQLFGVPIEPSYELIRKAEGGAVVSSKKLVDQLFKTSTLHDAVQRAAFDLTDAGREPLTLCVDLSKPI